MLRDLHAGATIPILNRKEMTVTMAEVLQVTQPTPQLNLQLTPNGVMPPRQMFSMRVKWNGREAVLSNLYADLSAAECSDGSGIVVCQDENALLAELKSSKANVDYLVSHHEDFINQSKWYEEQLAMRDPVRNAEMQNAKQVEAFKKELEDIVAEQNSKIDNLASLLRKALDGKEKAE